MAAELPTFAAWRHHETREGFEVAYPRLESDRRRFEGDTAGLLDRDPWAIHYALSLAPDWSTRSARVVGSLAETRREVVIEGDGAGRWKVDGEKAELLEGCLDVDLEASSLTNAFPVHRLGLEVGEEARAPAAWVRALDLSVERIEQIYLRLDDDANRQRYEYTAPELEFKVEIVYDEAGLVLEYPAIAVRAA